MMSANRDFESKSYYVFTTETGDNYTYFYSRRDEDRLCDLTLHRNGEKPKKIGSATQLTELKIGKSALFGVDTWEHDVYLLRAEEIQHIGLAPVELLSQY